MVRPILEYASSAWDPFLGIHINALQAVQNRAARFACRNYDREASVGTMQQQLGWRPLQERRFISRQAMLYKTVMPLRQTEATLPPKQLTANTLPSYITPVTDRVTRTGHEHCFNRPRSSIDDYRFSYFPRTLRAWNILPEHIVNAGSVDTFKDLLLKEFLEGRMFMVDPRSKQHKPRLGNTSVVTAVGPVY